jgi:GAF domain-containing protein
MTHTEVKPFTDKQIELVTTFADQAVIAINNVGLFEEVQARTRELQEALEYQTATGEILGVIAASPTDIQPVLRELADRPAAGLRRHRQERGQAVRRRHELRLSL